MNFKSEPLNCLTGNNNFLPISRILRLAQVKEQTGLSRSTIYAYIQAGLFPKRILLGPRCVGWLASEIDQWVEARIRQSRS